MDDKKSAEVPSYWPFDSQAENDQAREMCRKLLEVKADSEIPSRESALRSIKAPIERLIAILETKTWVKCPECPEEYNALMSSGVCFECQERKEEKLKKSQTKNENEVVDVLSLASGE